MELAQQSLFNIYDYVEKPVNDGKTGVKRGPYNKRKLPDLNPWAEMGRCYNELSNYCPVPLFSDKSCTLETNGLRLWYQVYTAENYLHYGNAHQGEEFKIIEAEIIGTELMPLEWRLFLHLSLLDFLKDGYSLSEGLSCVLELMEWHKAGFLLKDLFIYLWIMDCEGQNG